MQIGKEVDIGGDPELAPEWHEDIFDTHEARSKRAAVADATGQFASVDLHDRPVHHETRQDGPHEGSHNTMYYAQSWLVVHYLLNNNKLPEVGTYFDLVQNKKVPVDKAVVQAFDMTPMQMEERSRNILIRRAIWELRLTKRRSRMAVRR